MARKSTKTDEVVEEINAATQESVLETPVSEVVDGLEADLGKDETLTEVVEGLAETVGEALEEKAEQDEEPVVEEVLEEEKPTETQPEHKVEEVVKKSTHIFTPGDEVIRERVVLDPWIG